MKWIKKHLEMLSDFGDFKFKNFMDERAREFLEEIGVGEGQEILDWGCGSGTYAIPAAELVGGEGKVYALDIDENALGNLEEEARSSGIDNIVRLDFSGEEDLDVSGMNLDFILLIDVLHDIGERELLFRNFYESTREGVTLVVYPMHIENGDVVKMAESEGFNLVDKVFDEEVLVFNRPVD